MPVPLRNGTALVATISFALAISIFFKSRESLVATLPLRWADSAVIKASPSTPLGEGRNSTSELIKIVHITSPYRVDNCSQPFCPLGQDQSVAMESMIRARANARTAAVTLASAVFTEDADIVPAPFVRLANLARSTASVYPDLNLGKRMPFLGDIFDSLKTSADYVSHDYVVYTNADIILHENFYNKIVHAMSSREIDDRIDSVHNLELDAFLVNRQTIPKVGEDGRPYTAADLNKIFALKDVKGHPGPDCFVMRRAIFEKIVMGDLFLGIRPTAGVLLLQLMNLANNFRKFDSFALGVTYHLGNDMNWGKEDAKRATKINYSNMPREAVSAVLSFCKPDFDLPRKSRKYGCKPWKESKEGLSFRGQPYTHGV